MRIHELKCLTDYFEAVVSGEKPFEVRKDDRSYEVGDYLALNEVLAEGQRLSEELIYTGRCCLVRVTYKLSVPEYCKNGYVILGIIPCNVSTVERIPVPLCGQAPSSGGICTDG